MTSHACTTPRHGCALGGAIPAVAGIRGGVPLLHTGPGCGLQLGIGQHFGAGFQGGALLSGFALPCTNTYEREVVFGGADRLEETIRTTLDVMAAEFCVVLPGCTAAIIGDDVEAVVQRFRGGPVAVIRAETAGFAGNAYLGYERAWEAMIGQLIEPIQRQPGLVNVFGILPGWEPFWRGTLLEIAAILESLGLRPQTFYTDRQGMPEVLRSAGASLNVFLSPYVGQTMEAMYRERFGVPSVRCPAVPIGPGATDAFVAAVRQAMGLADTAGAEACRRERTRAFDALRDASVLMGGLTFQQRFAVIGDAATVIGITRFLANELGQIPVAAFVTDNPPPAAHAGIEAAVNDLEFGGAVPVGFVVDPDEMERELGACRPAYVLGSALDREPARRLNALHLGVSFPHQDTMVLNKTYAGCRGAITLVEDYLSAAIAGD